MQRGVCAALYLSVCMVRQGRCLVGGAACVVYVCAPVQAPACRRRCSACMLPPLCRLACCHRRLCVGKYQWRHVPAANSEACACPG